MHCLGIFLTHMAYPSFSVIHFLIELIAHSLFVFTNPSRLGLHTLSVMCMQLILCDTELLTVSRLQMHDSCLMQGFGFRPNGCIIPKSKNRGIAQLKGIHQGAVVLCIHAGGKKRAHRCRRRGWSLLRLRPQAFQIHQLAQGNRPLL